MGNLVGGLTGAAAGYATGGPIGAAIGGIAGLVGPGRQKMDPAYKRLLDFQMGIANQLKGYAGSVPLSDPLEQAALAQERGMLGQEQVQSRNQAYTLFNPATDMGNQADFMRNMASQETGQRMALDQRALLDALQARRQALLQASGVAQGAVGAAGGPRMQTGVDWGALASTIAQYQARKQGQGGGGGGSVSGTGGMGANTITTSTSRNPYDQSNPYVDFQKKYGYG